MKIAQKKEWAMHLFVKEQLTQKEIAARVDVREATVSSWVAKGGWRRMQQSVLATRATELANLYAQLAELNAAIRLRPEGERFANAKEADTLSKITSAIRSLETDTSIADIVDVFMKFNEYVRKVKFEAITDLVELEDAFIKSKLAG